MLNRVSFSEGIQMSREKPVIWLDVRLPNEHKQRRIADSINLPLVFLRLKMKNLDKQKTYIVYCDTGGRSSAAVFLMGLEGFDAYVLDKGLQNVKDEVLEISA